MGLNTENLFVRAATSGAVVSAVQEYLQGSLGEGASQSPWPLEVVFDRERVARGRKISVSEARNGWVALVDASGAVEPSLAMFLSRKLQARVIAVQLYEATGDCGIASIDLGVAQGGPTRDDLDDPMGAVLTALTEEGVLFPLMQFRETVGRGAVGWRTVSQRPGDNGPQVVVSGDFPSA